MTEWDRRIRDNHVWEEMRLLGPMIDQAVVVEGVDAEALAGLERIRAILAFCGKRLAAADPLIAIPDPFQEAGTAFYNARQLVEGFLEDKDASFVPSANAHADEALKATNRIPTVTSPEEVGALVSATVEFRTVIEQNVTAFRRSVKGFGDEIISVRDQANELATTLTAEQQKLALFIAEHQRQFSEAQEKRNEEFNLAQRHSQEELAQIVADYQGQFSAAQDTRGKDFTEAQGTRQDKFNEAVNEYTLRLTEQNAEFTRQRDELARKAELDLAELNTSYLEKGAEILKLVEGEKTRVEKLVGVIGNLGVTSGYLRTANHARWSMWFWQLLTVAAMVVLSILAYRTLPLLEDNKGHFSWGSFAARVLLLCSLGVIAAYAGSQGDKLFNIEKRNRKLALELEAIGPYLAPLPEDEQNKFRIQIGERSFGREDAGIELNSKSPATLLALLRSKEGKELVDLVADIVRKQTAG